MDRLAR